MLISNYITPVMYTDSTGYFWNLVVGTVIGAAVGFTLSVILQMLSTGSVDWGLAAVALGAGAISGLIASTGIGMFGSGVAGGLLGGVQDAASQLILNNGDFTNLDYISIGVSAGIGFAAGLMSGAGFKQSKAYRMKLELDDLRIYNTFLPNNGTASQISNILSDIGKQTLRDTSDLTIHYLGASGFAATAEGGKGWVLQFD